MKSEVRFYRREALVLPRLGPELSSVPLSESLFGRDSWDQQTLVKRSVISQKNFLAFQKLYRQNTFEALCVPKFAGCA
jgi:hypothetical protein